MSVVPLDTMSDDIFRPKVSKNAQEVIQTFYSNIGPPQTFNYPPSVCTFDGEGTQDFHRDLWAVWAGPSIECQKMFLNSVRSIDNEVVNIFPTVNRQELYSRCPAIRWNGDKYTYTEDKFIPNVMPIASRRMAPRNTQSTQEITITEQDTHTQGWESDIDFLSDENKARNWKGQLENANECISLTLAYYTILTILTNAVDKRYREYAAAFPYTHEEFVAQVDNKWDACFASVKPGAALTGIENRLVNQYVNKSTKEDLVILSGPGSGVLNYWDDRNREFYRSGSTNKDELKSDASVVGYTKLYKIPIYITGYYKLDDTANSKNPLEHFFHFSGSSLMLPAEDDTLDEDYTSSSRSIKIVNLESKRWEVISLKRAFENCGIFNYSSNNNQDYEIPTDHGRKILEVALGWTPSDANNRKEYANDKNVIGNDSRQSYDPYNNPFANMSDDIKSSGKGIADEMNAHDLFDNAGILDRVVSIIDKREQYGVLYKLARDCQKYFNGSKANSALEQITESDASADISDPSRVLTKRLGSRKRMIGTGIHFDVIKHHLKHIPLCKSFFDAMIANDIPFPGSFVNTRTFTFGTQPILSIVKGEQTGYNIIHHTSFSFNRNTDDDKIATKIELTRVTLIKNKDNLNMVEDAVPTRYISGGGIRLWDYNTQVSEWRKNQADSHLSGTMHVFFCPYKFKPKNFFLSKTGVMPDAIYAPAAQSMERDYPTAHIYNDDMWTFSNYANAENHMFSPTFYHSMNPRDSIIAFQEHQKLLNGDDDIPSRLPFGPDMDPKTMGALYGLTLEFNGGGGLLTTGHKH